MSRERESKYPNKKKFPFLDCVMATELMSTALPFAIRFVLGVLFRCSAVFVSYFLDYF